MRIINVVMTYDISIDDQTLAAHCIDQSREHQKALYDRYYPQVYPAARRILVDQALTEDALQDAWVQVFLKIDQWNRKGPLGGWIRQIVVRQALQILRSRKDLPWIDGLESTPDTPSEEAPISLHHIREAAEQLPDGARVVFSLYLMEGYTHEEISQIVGISLSTSKSQLHRAKALLRKSLSTYTHGS